MDQLPFEIITQIVLAGALSFSDRGADYRNLATYRVTLCSISTRLRHIALSTSSLWSRIKIYIDAYMQDAESRNRSLLPMLQLHLFRSGTAPLDFTLYIDYGPYEEASKMCEEAIWILMKPEMYRVQTFEMVGRPPTHHILPLDGHYPALRTISVLRTVGFKSIDSSEAIFTADSTPANLTSLELQAMNHSVFQNIPGAKLISLTILDWEVSWVPIHDFLLQCSQLVQCALHLRPQDSVTSFQPVLLPHLTSLSIQDPAIFHWLSMPCLKELSCIGDACQLAQIPPPDHPSNRADFVAQFKLKSLLLINNSDFEIFSTRSRLSFWETAFEHVTKVILQRSDVVPLALYLSELENTNVASKDDAPEFIQSQGEGFGVQRHFPSLQYFEIESCYIPDADPPDPHPVADHLGHLLEVRPGVTLMYGPALSEELEYLSPALRARTVPKDLKH
ncbi:hypothetical protein DL93DRAFT_2233994 [Clavulina sp. PMI_390]|nr:hypothetical protein DL93DRAFT_2233994 [Clavulina sp. PMI_390]